MAVSFSNKASWDQLTLMLICMVERFFRAFLEKLETSFKIPESYGYITELSWYSLIYWPGNTKAALRRLMRITRDDWILQEKIEACNYAQPEQNFMRETFSAEEKFPTWSKLNACWMNWISQYHACASPAKCEKKLALHYDNVVMV